MPLSLLNSGMSNGVEFDVDLLVYEYLKLELPIGRIAKKHGWSYKGTYMTLKKLGIKKENCRVGRPRKEK